MKGSIRELNIVLSKTDQIQNDIEAKDKKYEEYFDVTRTQLIVVMNGYRDTVSQLN